MSIYCSLIPGEWLRLDVTVTIADRDNSLNQIQSTQSRTEDND
jgi:hypothetical protein